MKLLLRLFLALTTLVVAFGSIAIAQVQMTGKIYTSNADGTIVNGNIYTSKDQVYVNGGPQNEDAMGIRPDGLYYFQVTDPSDSVLLSTDDISCREVQVTNGSIAGAVGPCPHANGTTNPANGQTPVQLIPYNDTPNPGGEYKVWLTPVQDYNLASCNDQHINRVYGFCSNYSATDNFKVHGPTVADITVCKFNDQNDNMLQDSGEPLLAHWPITATGVDGDTGSGVLAQTDDFGCVSFSVSTFPLNNTASVTLTEGTQGPDWTRTAPQDGSCSSTGADSCNASGGVITLIVSPGENVTAPNFGNFNPNCETGCTGNTLVVTKSAFPSLTRTYTWQIAKSVDNTQINTSGSATFNYTVSVTHDGGTDSAWQVTGTIRVANPTGSDISPINVTDALDEGSNGVCNVTGGPNSDGTGISLSAGTHIDLPYTCTFPNTPGPAAGTNTATAAWTNGPTVATHSYDFGAATINYVDGSVTVTDTLGGTLGNVSYKDPSPTTFPYQKVFTDPAGTCTTHPNTATFTANTTGATGSDSKSVKVCVGADLTVSKTATGAFTSNISKTVDTNRINTYSGGSATFNYTVTVTESGWNVTGNLTVHNPNDWEAVTVNLTDVLNLSGATCNITGGAVQPVPTSGTISPAYNCTFSGVPSAASGTNTATGTWDNAAYFTPDGSAQGTANFSFTALTVTDTYKGTLGTISVPTASSTFTYARTETAPNHTCETLPNTATITQTSQGSSQSVMLCGASDLMVTKSALGSFTSGINKTVDKTIVEQAGGSTVVTYTVTVTETGWNVSGNITVTNPNDWEAITANLGDTLSMPGATCVITGGFVQNVSASSFISPAYNCAFATAPPAAVGTNTATASWNPATAYTAHGSAFGTAGFSFASLSITDLFGTTNCTLGTVGLPTTTANTDSSSDCGLTITSPSWGVFKYSRTLANGTPGACATYNNTATITGGASSPQVTVNVCNTKTGALTMGFWKNTNGQSIISHYCGGTSGTSLMAYLTQYNPFKDDTATTCSAEATYVANVINVATCTSSSSTCNTMLRAQMLATALDVYFSTPSLGGSRISAYNGGISLPLGGINFNLSHVCSMIDSGGTGTCSGTYEDARPEFGISLTSPPTCLGTTVGSSGTPPLVGMLSYANYISSATQNGNPVATANTGATWYRQVKNPRQVYAKDSFDNINNQTAAISPTPPCNASY